MHNNAPKNPEMAYTAGKFGTVRTMFRTLLHAVTWHLPFVVGRCTYKFPSKTCI